MCILSRHRHISTWTLKGGICLVSTAALAVTFCRERSLVCPYFDYLEKGFFSVLSGLAVKNTDYLTHLLRHLYPIKLKILYFNLFVALFS